MNERTALCLVGSFYDVTYQMTVNAVSQTANESENKGSLELCRQVRQMDILCTRVGNLAIQFWARQKKGLPPLLSVNGLMAMQV